MNETDRIRKSYDEIPYDSFPYAMSHPDRMSVVGTLSGLSPAQATRCRVLELGCASAGNLIPMAQALANSYFLGVDLSPKQIEQGQSLIDTLGLKNIELRAQSIMDFPDACEPFDYIIAHGMYSWVPAEVRDKLLDICRQHLVPSGLCFISCKTFPGWHLNNVLRDLMQFHSQHHPDADGHPHAAREILEFAVSAFDNPAPQAALARQMASNLLRVPEMYLSHDHLSPINHPVLFEQFAAHAGAHGLRYVGHADPASDNLWRMPADWQQKISGWAAGLIQKEQYADFLCWRAIRANVLCRADAVLDEAPPTAAIALMHLAGRPQEAATGDPRSPVRFFIADRFITVGDSALIFAMRAIKELWPNSISFEELITSIPTEQRGDPSTLHRRLSNDLLTAYRLRLVELWTRPVRFNDSPSKLPQVTDLVRWQAERSPLLTTLRHDTFHANDAMRRLIALLDGTRSVTALQQALHTSSSSEIEQMLKSLADESLLLD